MNFRNQRPWRHHCRLYNNHVKDTQGHRKSCQVRALCVASRHWRSKNMTSFFFLQCIIKQLLDSVDHVYFVHPSTYMSTDISTDTRSICRPSPGRHISVDISTVTRPIHRPTHLGRHIDRHSTEMSTDISVEGCTKYTWSDSVFVISRKNNKAYYIS